MFKKISVRLVEEPYYLDVKINNCQSAVDYVASEIKVKDRECMAVILVTTKSQPIAYEIVSIGRLDATLSCPRELLKSAILSNAHGIILVHNHPAGTIDPSIADENVTIRIMKLCNLIGIELLDHIIVAPYTDNIYSFKVNGDIFDLKKRA